MESGSAGRRDRRRHFILDASALVPFFLPARSQEEHRIRAGVSKLLGLHTEGEALLYVPIVCMAECSKAFARICFDVKGDREAAADRYRRKIEGLLDMVSTRRQGLIRTIGLTRKHLVDIEDIFLAQYELRPRNAQKLLSGLDALIISMGRQMARHHGGRERVFLVTADEWMAQVCNHGPDFLPRALYILKDPIPDG